MTRHRIVCDTGPLIALSLLGFLSRDNPVFDFVTTDVVLGEWLSLKNDVPATVKVMTYKGNDPLLNAQLDLGEASVIGLAQQEEIPTVLMDEKRGRKICRDIYGLTVIGTARVLIEWKKTGWIPEVKSCLDRLQKEGYWFSTALQQWVLRQAGEEDVF